MIHTRGVAFFIVNEKNIKDVVYHPDPMANAVRMSVAHSVCDFRFAVQCIPCCIIFTPYASVASCSTRIASSWNRTPVFICAAMSRNRREHADLLRSRSVLFCAFLISRSARVPDLVRRVRFCTTVPSAPDSCLTGVVVICLGVLVGRAMLMLRGIDGGVLSVQDAVGLCTLAVVVYT